MDLSHSQSIRIYPSSKLTTSQVGISLELNTEKCSVAKFPKKILSFLLDRTNRFFFSNGRMAQWLRHPPTERGIPGSNPGVID